LEAKLGTIFGVRFAAVTLIAFSNRPIHIKLG
jgi:hypothetical protein